MPTRLSPRQLECATLFAKGYQAQEIGRILSIQTKTVQGHIDEAYERLGVRGRPALRRLLRIESGEDSIGVPSLDEHALADLVGEASAASETATDERSAFEIYKALGRWRSPPRPPGGRATVVVILAVLSSMAIGTLLLVLSTVYLLLNSTGSWH
ncbi:MAG: helix-turn-helix transcriptional regulator [Caulobacteraceae bacterium]|nr:helix-turn-helix transcriptional regulator [Caulobacteraceae bacterium]